ncbi:zinc finger protein ubi-d4-like isoform X2 [Vombatus ursinus]|uniref:zinc finger protein ubi-d4-like isoform X2 n=1 Tax=Vombatus ursinus TaxID=29139 RepID=UPI000FFD469E|nr:zinc finger protein ubi-d4-like isoform X2 [Vombatus ursinus]
MAFLSEQSYKDAIDECHSYNARLCAERHQRLPFLDSQTGVAQSNSYIWMEKQHRGPGLAPGQCYSYPSRRWQKKRQAHLLEDITLFLASTKPDAEGILKKKGLIAQARNSPRALVRTNILGKQDAGADDDRLGGSQVTTSGARKQTLEFQDEDEVWVADHEEDKPKQGRGKAKAKGGERSFKKSELQEMSDKEPVF